MTASTARAHLEKIFTAALRRVDPYQMMIDHIDRKDSRLIIRLEGSETVVDLDDYRRVIVIGAGKAGAPMARALETILGDRIETGLVVVKTGHAEPLSVVEIVEAAHPVPDENGVAAARRILDLARSADETTLVIPVISGGGSALLPLPLVWGDEDRAIRLTLAHKQRTTEALLACGATIGEINCIRKHLSGVKGGRLLGRIAPARSLSFILSDVVGDDLSSIASGITAPDPTTYADAIAIIDRYGIEDAVPEPVREVLIRGQRGEIPETLKPDDFAATMATNFLIGTNLAALDAAAEAARDLGYPAVRLTRRATGEARELARTLAAVAADAATAGMLVSPPACILSGGEPTVTLRGTGKGGRNQEMALAVLQEMAAAPELFASVAFLAAATDGTDGPTDAAGAFADLDLLKRARQCGLDPAVHLANNDAYPFFDAIDGLLKTGPTRTNVCDLHLMLIGISGTADDDPI